MSFSKKLLKATKSFTIPSCLSLWQTPKTHNQNDFKWPNKLRSFSKSS